MTNRTNKLYYFVIVFLLTTVSFSQSDKIAELKRISTLEGNSFFEALGHYSFSSFYNYKTLTKQIQYTLSDTLDIYWTLIKKISAYNDEDYDTRISGIIFTKYTLYDMLLKAGKSEYSKLLSFYSELPDNSLLKQSDLLIPLCEYWTKSEVEYLILNNIKSNRNLVFSRNFVIPKSITSLSEKLKDDWYIYKSFETDYKNRINKDTTSKWYYVQKNYDLFYAEVEKILKSDSVGKHMEEILKYNWGGWCGTGSEFYYDKQRIAILILLLKERNYPAILGDINFAKDIGYKNFTKLIQLCGYNWIDYYTGALLDGKWWNLTPEFQKKGYINAANNLIEMRNYKFKNKFEKQNYMSLCYQFIVKPTLVMPEFNLEVNQFFGQEFEGDKDSMVEVPAKIKSKLMSVIVQIAEKDSSMEVCKTAIDMFYNFKFNEEIKGVLLKYSKSKFKVVREKAVELLNKRGVNIEIPKDKGILTFRLFVDNTPLKNCDIIYELYCDSSKHSYSISSSRKTSDKGLLIFTKDELLNNGTEKIKLRTKDYLPKQTDILFDYDISLSKDIKDTLDVFISTATLYITFEFNRDKKFYNNKEIKIYLAEENILGSHIGLLIPAKEKCMIPGKLQKGKYYISIDVPGSSHWDDLFEISDDTTNLTVNLKHGTNVLVNIKAPGGNKADSEVKYELYNNTSTDKYFFAVYDDFLGGYESLPVGNYTLKIFSSKEKEEQLKKLNQYYQNEIVPSYPDYKGKEITFTIDNASPENIDLGTIELEAIN